MVGLIGEASLWRRGVAVVAAGFLVCVVAVASAAEDSENADLADRAARLADEAERRLGSAEAHADDIESLRRTVDQVLALLEGAREVNDGLKTDVNILSRNLTESDVEGEKARDLNAELEQKIAELTAALLTARSQSDGSKTDLESERRRLQEMNDKMAALGKDLAARDKVILGLQATIATMTSELAKEREQSTSRQGDKSSLEKRLAALTAEQKKLIAERDEARRKIVQLAKKIDGLDAELRQAEAGELEELARYRSEFFGRLRRVLGGRRDIRVEGDRFVFQSEVLFASGSAELGQEGQRQLGLFASTLRDISSRFPRDLAWVLRVDGHTDSNPIATVRFPSNWELSAARAISVVRFLVSQDIPAERLVAAGFGQHHPVDDGSDEIAHRRNRRIEMKLTQR
jgi:chemotaxis protein MotB